jgi:hypothetical protein
MAKENRPVLTDRKGWKGFVWGYRDFLEKNHWDDVEWNRNPEDSGAKEIHRRGNKIVYKF